MQLTLLFTSDEHGYLRPAKNLQSAVAHARQENPEGTLLISSGDFFEGSADTGILGVAASQSVVEKAGYDVMTLGNHDFDRGQAVARKWVKDSPCEVLLCNVRDETTGGLMEGAQPSRVIDLNGVKVGLIGVTTQETATILPESKLQGFTFEDPTQSVQKQVDELRSQGVELLGLVSHLGLTADRKLAEAVPELDFILGGHSHDASKEPETVGQTLIAHPGCFRQSMGKLELNVTPEGQIASHKYELLQAKTQPEEAGALQEFVDQAAVTVEHKLSAKVADFPQPLAHDPNLLYDSMESIVVDAALATSGAQIALVNQKLIRGGLPAGEVTRKDIFNVLPFDNRLTTTEMTAGQVSKIYADSYTRLNQTCLTDIGPTTAACNIDTHEMGLVRMHPDAVPKGAGFALMANQFEAPYVFIDPSEKMLVATTDYLLAGGLGYFGGAQKGKEDYGTVRDVLQNYLESGFASVKGCLSPALRPIIT